MAIKDLTTIKKHLFFCNGGSCKKRGAEESTAAVRLAIAAHGLSDSIHTTKTLCNGRCNDGPVVIAQPDGIWFQKIDTEKAEEFVRQYLVEQQVPWDNVLYAYGQNTIRVV